MNRNTSSSLMSRLRGGLLLGLSLLLASAPFRLPAAQFGWDTDVDNDAEQGGSGIWNTSNTNWYDLVNLTNATWSVTATNDEAMFNFGVGIVDLAGGTVTANRLSFADDGFVLTNGTVSLGGVGPSIFTETSMNATLAVTLAGSAGVVYAGNGFGALTLAAQPTYAGTSTFTNAAWVILTNGVTLPTNTTIRAAAPATNFSAAPYSLPARAVLDLGGATQQVAQVTFGTNFNLAVSNGALTVVGDANFSQIMTVPTPTVEGVVTNNSANPVSQLDLSGLASFTYNRSNRGFYVNTGLSGSFTNRLLLALQNGGTNFIRASEVAVGSASTGGGANGGSRSVVTLGLTNTIHSPFLRIGGYQVRGEVVFPAAISNGVLTLRGPGGDTNRMSGIIICNNTSGSQTSGDLNLTRGRLDARVTNVIVGADGNSDTVGTLTMPDGTLDALEIIMGQRLIGGGTTRSTSGTLTQGGGLVRATSIVFTTHSDGVTSNRLSAIYNMNGGTLQAGVMQVGPVTYTPVGYASSLSVRRLAFNAGTLTHYDAVSDLIIRGGSHASNYLMNIVLGTTTNKLFHADAGRQILIDTNVVMSGTGALTKTGDGTLRLLGTNNFTGGLRILAGTTELGAGQPISGSNVLTFGGNALLNLGGNAQTVTNLALTGSNFTAVVTNGSLAVLGSANLSLTPTAASNTVTTVDMSSLSSVSVTLTNFNVAIGGGSYGNLVQWKTSALSNTITANYLELAVAGGLGTWPFNSGALVLGQSNVLNIGSGTGTAIRLGGYRNNSNSITFAAGLVNPGVVIRAKDGVSRAGDIHISEASSGTSGGQLMSDRFDLGVADALVGNVSLGRTVQLGSNPSIAGIMSLTGGTLDATNLVMGYGIGGAVYTNLSINFLGGTLTQSGGTVLTPRLVFGDLVLPGLDGTTNAPIFQCFYALKAGELKVGSVLASPSGLPFRSTSLRRIDWNSGTIRNYDASTDVTFNGLAGAGGGITLSVLAGGPHTFLAESGRSITLNPFTTLMGAATNGVVVKDGPGRLVINSINSFAGATLVNAGTLGGTGSLAGALTILSGGTIAPGTSAGTFGVGGLLTVSNGAAYAWEHDGVNSDLLTANAARFSGPWTVAVAGTPADGTYTLISTAAGVSNFVAPSVTGITNGIVSVSGNNVILTVGAGPVLTPFESWQTTHFGSPANPNAAYNADPDLDGVNNLLEYAFESVPTSASSVNLPQSGMSWNFLTITVPRNSNATDVSYLVQGSTNLDAWATVSTLSATSPAPAGSTVTYTNATGFDAFPAQFLRVKVTQP